MTLEELVGWLDDNDVSCEIDDAGRLTVKGNLREEFRDWVGACKYTSLPDELICVEGDLWLERTSITSLGNLASVGWSLDLRETPIISLGNLTSVGGDLDLKEASLTSLGRLTFVRGFCSLEETSVTSLDSLTSVGGWLDLRGALLASLNDLPQVGGDLCLDQSQCRFLTKEALQKVGGEIQYRDQVENGWVTLSPDELEAIVAENERREKLNNTRESNVDWDLYDR